MSNLNRLRRKLLRATRTGEVVKKQRSGRVKFVRTLYDNTGGKTFILYHFTKGYRTRPYL